MEGTTTNLIEIVIENAGKVMDFGTELLVKVIENPVLGLFFAAGFVGTGVYVVKRLIGLAKR